jgi:hypothetical protein
MCQGGERSVWSAAWIAIVLMTASCSDSQSSSGDGASVDARAGDGAQDTTPVDVAVDRAAEPTTDATEEPTADATGDPPEEPVVDATPDATEEASSGDADATTPDQLRHFMAIHCDPGRGADPMNEFTNLETMVADANERSLRLTIMLTAQWADYIVASSDRLRQVRGWGEAGHELAGHHHSVYHPGSWDGYTDFSDLERREIRGPSDRTEYLGTLDDWADHVMAVASDLSSGCSNGEVDKRSIPDVIRYDSCPGFYTTDAYTLGTRAEGDDPLHGRNDFVLVGETAGVERRFLSHSIIAGGFLAGATSAFDDMTEGAYGVIVHTHEADVTALRRWMDHVVSVDAAGGTSTLRDIIQSGILPERRLSDDVFNLVYDE